MNKEDALDYCHQHKSKFKSEAYAEKEDGTEQYDCLISCLESGEIQPNQLSDYGMSYPDDEKNMCDSCSNEFATCGADMAFGIEIDKDRRGKQADIVLACKGYLQKCPICESPIIDGKCEDVGGKNCRYTVD